MNSKLQKAIHMKHTLRNKFKNRKCSWFIYTKQRNLITSLRRTSYGTYFRERCHGGTKNQHFWTTVKPLMSNRNTSSSNNIMLMEENEIISDQKLVSEIFNNYFTNIANTIGFTDSLPEYLTKDSIVQITTKYENHPGIINNQTPYAKLAYGDTGI